MKERSVIGDVSGYSHAHEQVQTCHVNTGEETVGLTMGGFVQVVVVPESIFMLVLLISSRSISSKKGKKKNIPSENQ